MNGNTRDVSRPGQPLTDHLFSNFRVDQGGGHQLPASLQMPRQDPVAFRIHVILAVLADLHINPMCIPRGQKKLVMVECLKHQKVFTASTFEAAWKQASKCRHLCVENRGQYTKGRDLQSVDSASVVNAWTALPPIPVAAVNSDKTTQFISSTPSGNQFDHAVSRSHTVKDAWHLATEAGCRTAYNPKSTTGLCNQSLKGHEPMRKTPTVRKSKSRTYEITPQGLKLVPPRAKKKPPQPSSRVIHVEMLFASDAKTGSSA